MTRIKINKSLRSLRLGLVFLFTLLMSATSWGSEVVYYLDENGVERGVEDYVILDTLLPKVQKDPYSNDRFVYLPSGWYVVNDRVTFEGQIYFRKDEGDANLIIADNAELNVVDYEKDILFGISGQERNNGLW